MRTTILNKSTPEAPLLQEGQFVGSRYRIVALLGEGGMGVVYRARDLELNVDVALKLLKPSMLEEEKGLERLKTELLLARQVSHRNVVRIHDFGSDPNSSQLKYISMAFIEGRTLRDILESERALPVERGLALILSLADGLQAAHEVGVIHRDFKPENIICDFQGQPIITDFGIARSAGTGSATRTGAVLGTLQYMSPEQARGERVDPRSDVYSFGLVAYEILTGRLPHESDATSDFVARTMGKKPRDPREHIPDLPGYLAEILLRCVQPDRAHRFPSMQAVSVAIREKRSGGFPRQYLRLLSSTGRWWVVAVVILILVIGAFLAPGGLPDEGRTENSVSTASIPAVARESIAVLPFVNRAPESGLDWLDTALPELLFSELAHSPFLRVAGAAETAQLLADLKIEPESFQADSTLRQAARFLSCNLILSGSFARAGADLAIDLKVFKSRAGNIVHTGTLRRTGPPEKVFVLASELASELREQIDPSLESSELQSTLPTLSLKAWKQYSKGLERLRQGEYSQAIGLFQMAIGDDPDFSQAYAKLSEAYYRWGRPEEARRVYEKGVETMQATGRLELLDSLQIQAQHALLTNDLDEAVQLLTRAAKRYPFNVEIHLSLGDAYEKKGELEKAAAAYEKAASLEPNNFLVGFSLGRFYILMDKYDAAIEKLSHALATSTQLGNQQGRADVLNALGLVHQHMRRFDEASRSFLESIAIKKEIDDRRGIAVSLQNIANLNSIQGRYDEAILKAEEALGIFEELDNPQGMADVLFNLGHIYEDTGRFNLSLEFYRRALTMARDLGNPSLLAQLDERIGQVYYFLGRYMDSETYLRQALLENERMGDELGVIRSLQSLGNIDIVQARFPTALERHRDALGRSRRLGAEEPAAVSISQMGLIYQLTGRYKAAFASYREARESFSNLKIKGREAEIEKRLASLYLDIYNLPNVHPHVARAAAQAQSLKDEALLSEVAIIEAELAVAEKKPEAARRAVDRATQYARKSGYARSLLQAEIYGGRLESVFGERRQGVKMLQASLEKAEQIQDAEASARCFVFLLENPEAKLEPEILRRWFDRLRDQNLRGYLLKFGSLAQARLLDSGRKEEAQIYQKEQDRLLDQAVAELETTEIASFLTTFGR